MMRPALTLLSLIAIASAASFDQLKLLSDLQSHSQQQQGDIDYEGRELWEWISTDNQKEGERCGNHNTCAAGLDCTEVAFGSRCSASVRCLESELLKFHGDFDVEQFKQELLQEAGVTQEQIAEAAAGSEGSDFILQNKSIRSFISAMHKSDLGQLDQISELVLRCSSPNSRRILRQSLSPPPTPAPTKRPTPAPTKRPTPRPTPPPTKRPTPPPTKRPTLSPTKRPTKRPTLKPTSRAPTRKPTMSPTRAPSASPSENPTIFPKRSFFTGFSIEGGALVEGAFTIFWDKNSPLDFPRVYVKGCLGIGPTLGAELSFVTIIAETADPTEIQCLSTMYDVDVAVGLGAGYGLGVCMLTEPTFLYQEIKVGVGLGVGASTFSVCDGAQIANGYDDGIDNNNKHI